MSSRCAQPGPATHVRVPGEGRDAALLRRHRGGAQQGGGHGPHAVTAVRWDPGGKCREFLGNSYAIHDLCGGNDVENVEM